jgi:hypothetical protein
MNNNKILQSLEKQRDQLFKELKQTSIPNFYKELYESIRSGRLVVFDKEERAMLSDLKRLSKDTTYDSAYTNKLTEFINLDNEIIIEHFQNEFMQVLNQIIDSNKQDEIQALSIEYDYYYDYTSCITCFGLQNYPVIEVPRYISGEYDYNKQVLFLDNGINFEPAWLDCQEFEELDYIQISLEFEELFKLHSRTLLHRALANLDISGELNLFKNKPFSIYIKEHDCEDMMLYRIEHYK